MNYYARFRANHGAVYNVHPYVYTNKQKAISEIREIVKANHYQQYGNVSYYEVYDDYGNPVASGSLHDHTKRWHREFIDNTRVR